MIPKFRAWHKKLKCWCEPREFSLKDMFDTSFSAIGLTAYEEDCAVSVIYEDLEIMQWTGLYDVNGKFLYEGDIIELRAKFTDGSSCIDNYEIVRGEGCYGVFYPVINDGLTKEFTPLLYLNKEGGAHFFCAILKGNKWGNPKLLAGEK